MGIMPVIWQEWILFKRKFKTISAGALVSPLLYMLAFGLGLGKDLEVNGQPYLVFVIPGIIALTTMNTSYSSIAVLLNIHRIYDKTFEEFIISPLSMFNFTLGKVIAGALRGMYAGAIIIILSFLFGVNLNINIWFIILMFLNALIFAGVGFYAALIIDSHANMSRFSTFVITPMIFLCGTFFPVDNMPLILKKFIYVLPLTHASQGLRSLARGDGFHWMNIFVLLIYLIIVFILGLHEAHRVES